MKGKGLGHADPHSKSGWICIQESKYDLVRIVHKDHRSIALNEMNRTMPLWSLLTQISPHKSRNTIKISLSRQNSPYLLNHLSNSPQIFTVRKPLTISIHRTKF